MPENVLNTLYTAQLIVSEVVSCYNSDFIPKETRSKKIKYLPRVTQIVHRIGCKLSHLISAYVLPTLPTYPPVCSHTDLFLLQAPGND